jgi:hypothetical protein
LKDIYLAVLKAVDLVSLKDRRRVVGLVDLLVDSLVDQLAGQLVCVMVVEMVL